MDNFSVIIPCAGLGSRLHSNKPKSLTRFNDGDFLFEKQLNLINDVFDFPEIIMIGGFQSQKLQNKLKNKVKYCTNNYYENTNVAYSVSLGMEQSSSKNSLIIYGDLFFNEETLNIIKDSGTYSFLLIDRTNLDNDEIGCWGDNKINRLDYGLSVRWGQIAYLKEKDKKKFIKNTFNNREKMLGFEVLNSIIDEGSIINPIETDDNCQLVDIDNYRDILKINKEYI